MKRIEHSVLLAGLLAFGLAACTTDSMRYGETAGTTVDESPTGISYGTPVIGQGTSSMGSTAGTASTATGTGATTDTTTDPQRAAAQASTATGMPAAPPNSVVTMIEVVPRMGDATGAGTMAGAAVGGTTATSDRVYRITLRMDDGSTRMVTQEWAPTFRSGDRVNLSGGEIQRR